METKRGIQGAAESAYVIDMVIEDLDEFAVAGSRLCGLCGACGADYIIQAMAPVAVG